MNTKCPAEELFRSGYSCSQAILAVYGEGFGLKPEVSCKLACGFSGGMAMGETCGAVTGAYMVLGFHYAGPDCATTPGRANTKAAVLDFNARFKARRGTLLCRELLGCDISTSEGLARARESGLFKEICPALVRDASEILDEMLSATK